MYIVINSNENAHSESLNQLEDAVGLWNTICVDFAISLGDLIDGQNSGTSGQGNSFFILVAVTQCINHSNWFS